MAIKTLEVTLSPQVLAAGWYQDPATGQWYYYDEEGNRYVYVAGYLYPQVQWEPAPKVVNVRHDDTLKILVSFKYSGPAKTLKLRGCIGNLDTIWPYDFDEVLFAWSDSFTLPKTLDPTTFNKEVDILITTAIADGKSYSIYAKLEDGISFTEGKTGSVALRDAIFVVSAEPTFTDFKIEDYQKV
ncbi:MAG: hypothetical protein H8D49_02490 [Dehalococcoidia bacterium]|nr:hypothetical protein [Dehalococcoidia bacterium]MBL7166996.1 hypothetical protein [Dehalococcoidales bacterium]